jgi:hypothetical protein
MSEYDSDAPPILTPPKADKVREMTLTVDQIDAFLRAAVYAVDAGYPDIDELNDVVNDLRARHVPMGLVIQFPRQPQGGRWSS